MTHRLARYQEETSNLVDLLRWRADYQAEQIAYTFLVNGEDEDVSVCYAELDRRARHTGALLQAHVHKGERAVLLYPPGLEYIAAYYGCLYAGVVAVPAYPPKLNKNANRIKSILANVDASIVLTTPQIFSLIVRQFPDEPTLQKLRWIFPEMIADIGSDWRDPGINCQDVAFIQYTSGTTAEPRGVQVTHRNILYNVEFMCRSAHLDATSRSFSWLPPFHDMGLISGILFPLYGGFPAISMSPAAFQLKPMRWLEGISRYRATISAGPSFAYEACTKKVSSEQLEMLDLNSWHVAVNAAEPINYEVMKRFAATFASCGFRYTSFFPGYGLAEATLFVAGGPRESPMVRNFDTAALAKNLVQAVTEDHERARTIVGSSTDIEAQKIIIVNPETQTLCAPDEVGEIWVAGPCVAKGYWREAKETQHIFQAHLADSGEGPFLRTKDLGFIYDDALFITGRASDILVFDETVYYPQDIELTMKLSHPLATVGHGAAFSVNLDGDDRLVVVQEVHRHTQKGDLYEIMQCIKQAVVMSYGLDVYSINLVQYGSISKTSSGKIQRSACRTAFLTGALDDVIITDLSDNFSQKNREVA